MSVCSFLCESAPNSRHLVVTTVVLSPVPSAKPSRPRNLRGVLLGPRDEQAAPKQRTCNSKDVAEDVKGVAGCLQLSVHALQGPAAPSHCRGQLATCIHEHEVGFHICQGRPAALYGRLGGGLSFTESYIGSVRFSGVAAQAHSCTRSWTRSAFRPGTQRNHVGYWSACYSVA